MTEPEVAPPVEKPFPEQVVALELFQLSVADEPETTDAVPLSAAVGL